MGNISKMIEWIFSMFGVWVYLYPGNADHSIYPMVDNCHCFLWLNYFICFCLENEEEPQTSDLPGSDNSDTDQNQDNELAMEVDRWYISKQDDKSHDHLPCLVAMLGSGVGYYVVRWSWCS